MNEISLGDRKAFSEAYDAHRAGDLERAKQLYEGLLARYPDLSPLLNAIGTVYLDCNRIDEAEKYFKKATLQAPPYIPALYNLARIKQIKAETSHALALYERITQLQPEFGPAWNNLALILRGQGRMEQACRAMEKAAGLMLDHAEVFNNLGVMLEAVGRLQEAETSFLKAIELHQDYFSAHFNLACLYHRLERFNDAERELEWILARRPNDPGALFLLQSLGRLPSPQRAPTEYVSKTFDDCAVTFEEKLAKLEYKTPQMLFSKVRPYLGHDMTIMDLGCGTGLGAEFYRPFARSIHGMDCSERMLSIAEKKGIYHRLIRQDILSRWKTDKSYDLIYSSDCLVYFGDLRPVFSIVAQHLRPGGIFAFTVEGMEEQEESRGYVLRRSGRFAHSTHYVETCLRNKGFDLVVSSGCVLRKEAGKPVTGLLVVARLVK